jgi:hypothetical protein
VPLRRIALVELNAKSAFNVVYGDYLVTVTTKANAHERSSGHGPDDTDIRRVRNVRFPPIPVITLRPDLPPGLASGALHATSLVLGATVLESLNDQLRWGLRCVGTCYGLTSSHKRG